MHYFVSDIHLGSGDAAEQRRVERRFLDFLSQIEADAKTLFLVGDIFDFWFEYNEVVPKGFVRVLGRLAELSDMGVRVVMLTGNHDMWVGNYLTKECGIELYTKPQHISLAGKELFVAHGDNMNIAGQPVLQLMNKMFRSKVLRKVVSWLIHPNLFLRFGKWWSGKSRKSHSKPRKSQGVKPVSVEMLSYLTDYARKHHSKDDRASLYIFGHMHIAHRTEIEDGVEVVYLSHWAGKKATYAVMDSAKNVELKEFSIDETIS